MANVADNTNQRAAVERIVRQVLAELRAARSTGTSQAHGMLSVGSPDRTLTLTSKIITGTSLEGRLENITQLIVPRGAIITPAARDELRKFKVTIASSVGTSKSPARQHLCLATHGKYDAAPLTAGLAADKLQVERFQASDLPATVSELAPMLATIRGLLITDEAAAAVALANRKPGVRAALVCNAAEIDRAAGSLSPNLLVIDPIGRSVFELRGLVRHWLRHPEPACPAALAPYLN